MANTSWTSATTQIIEASRASEQQMPQRNRELFRMGSTALEQMQNHTQCRLAADARELGNLVNSPFYELRRARRDRKK